jgi:hypothetical protein
MEEESSLVGADTDHVGLYYFISLAPVDGHVKAEDQYLLRKLFYLNQVSGVTNSQFHV